MNLTYWIIGITVLTSWAGFDKPDLIRRFSMNPYAILKRQEYYRFVTSGFIHVDFSHLLWNMFSLYFFGRVVEVYFGFVFGDASPVYFVLFYILAVVVSDVPNYFKYKDHPSYHSLGASGGVAAVIFASILFQPLEEICIYIVFCLPGVILGIAYLAWSYYKGRHGNDHINHTAHLYGALFGLLFCAIMAPRIIPHFLDQLKTYRIFE